MPAPIRIMLAAALATAPAAIHARSGDQPGDARAGDAAARARSYNDAVLAVARTHLGLAARADAFGRVVRDWYDMPVIAQLVAGPAWSGWSAGERQSVIAALARHSAVSLARNFAGGGARFAVDPRAVDRGTSQLVTVHAGDDTLIYRMRQGRIVDVTAGGVSQLALQRADLASTVAAGGAAGLVRRLAQLDAVR